MRKPYLFLSRVECTALLSIGEGTDNPSSVDIHLSADGQLVYFHTRFVCLVKVNTARHIRLISVPKEGSSDTVEPTYLDSCKTSSLQLLTAISGGSSMPLHTVT